MLLLNYIFCNCSWATLSELKSNEERQKKYNELPLGSA